MAGKNEIIGGEFELDIRRGRYHLEGKTSSFGGLYRYSSGRSALYHIFLDIKEKCNIHRVLLPDYLCSSIFFAAEKAGMDVYFYELDENLELDKVQFLNSYERNTAVLIINYFGLQDIGKQVSYVRSIDKETIIIEDDVQAYYEFLKDLNGVDYKVTSLRKSFPCPDGGLVKTRLKMNAASGINVFHQYKLAGSILKAQRALGVDDDMYLNLFKKGELMIDDEMDTGMSETSLEIISKTDLFSLSDIRFRNADYLVKGLDHLGIRTIFPLATGKVPLFVPVYLENRDGVRQHLFHHNVFCPVHWPVENLNLKKGREMAQYELSLIVDFRYSVAEMQYILELIEASNR